MTGLLASQRFVNEFGAEVVVKGAAAGLALELIVLPLESGARLSSVDCQRIEIAFESSDLRYGNREGFSAALRAAPNLRWYHFFGVGVDEPRLALATRGVRVTNSVGVNAEPVAVSAITGLLMLARGFPRWLELKQRHEWRPIDVESPDAPRDLDDQTMVLIGLGAIGSRIAELATALGMRVIGVRRSPPDGRERLKEVVQTSDLDRVLPLADWLVLAPVLTPETSGMIDARRLALLPAGAHLINISRGAVIDEAAMIRGLEDGRLGGAYLDVFTQEPLPAESPLWRLPNVIITPHTSASSRGKFRREADMFFDNLSRWGRGEALLNEIGRPKAGAAP